MKNYILILYLLIFVQLNGQNVIQQTSTPKIEVSGTASINLIPDEIFISFTLKYNEIEKNSISIKLQETELKKRLSKGNISLENLYLNHSGSDLITIRKRKKGSIRTSDYTIKVSNTKEVETVFEIFGALEILNGQIFKTEHSKIAEHKRDLRIKAIKIAKQKADDMLNAIGEETGKPLHINENNQTPHLFSNQLIMNANYKVENKTDGFISPEIKISKIKLQTTVFVQFSIK
ncbi:MAG: SIMPL domain-containing protein [Flavobacteriales bacterium]